MLDMIVGSALFFSIGMAVWSLYVYIKENRDD